ncbi:MAG: hypothetical protein L0196_07555 [candidate division Zixibacteria bacterium]|nr:hypothetical protein [candidate division Zixibacteria bacterium]
MKSVKLALMFLLAATAAWAQDPRDSIIIESKAVASGLAGTPPGTPAFEVLVYTTNKDSLSYMVLNCSTRTISGGGYALLNRTATGQLTFGSIVRPLTPFGSFFTALGATVDDVSPDAFKLPGGGDGVDPATNWPPHSARTPVWALKFRASSATAGEMLISEAFLFGSQLGSYFTSIRALDVEVNFRPGVLSVGIKGDLNLGGDGVTGADIVWEIRCVLGGETPPAGRAACDLNCDGTLSAADIITMITYNFVTLTWPC